MYHSVSFTRSDNLSKNTWADWKLIPTTPPMFAPPSVNEQMVAIPGADGQVDLTDVLVGRATFANSSGQWTFIVTDYGKDGSNRPKTWSDVYSEILQFFHGWRMRVVLEDDPLYYREGRFSVANWQPGKNWTQVTIKYNVGPYKKYVNPETQEESEAKFL